MPCFPPMPDAAPIDDVARTAAVLAGKPIRAIAPARPGGNNRIFRVEAEDGQVFALKIYPAQDADPRDRLGAEWAALRFIAGNELGPVPAPIAAAPEQYAALYGWVTGAPTAVTRGAVRQLADFLAALQALTGADGAVALRPASAACFSANAALAQLEQRRRRLDAPAREHPPLAAFLAEALDPAIASCIAEVRAAYAAAGRALDHELEAQDRCLSPSDFGLHNTLADAQGGLTFLDFEYFGWDDPAKAVSDVVLHPGSALPDDLARTFLERAVPVFTVKDPHFPLRLKTLYPVFALIWCLIVLNEFLPERWARRVIAGTVYDQNRAQAHQLDKARGRLATIRNLPELAPFLATA